MQKHGHASCGCWRPRPSRGCVCSAGAFHRAPSVYAHLELTGSSAPPRYSVADVRISRRSKLGLGPFQHEFNRNPLSFLRRGCRTFGSCASWCTPGNRNDRRAPPTPSGMVLNGVSVSFFQGNAELALPYGVVPTAVYLSTSPRQQHIAPTAALHLARDTPSRAVSSRVHITAPEIGSRLCPRRPPKVDYGRLISYPHEARRSTSRSRASKAIIARPQHVVPTAAHLSCPVPTAPSARPEILPGHPLLGCSFASSFSSRRPLPHPVSSAS